MVNIVQDLGVKKVSFIAWAIVFLTLTVVNGFIFYLLHEEIKFLFILISSGLSGLFFILFIPTLIKAWEGKSKAEARAKEFLSHDTTTGFMNKHFFISSLRREMSSAKRYKNRFSLMFIEVANYNQIVEKHGRNTIEHVLKEVGRRVKELLRDSDIVGKYDTSVFSVILTNAKTDAISTVETRLKDVVEKAPVYFKDKIFVDLKIATKEFDSEEDVDSDIMLNGIEKLLVA